MPLQYYRVDDKWYNGSKDKTERRKTVKYEIHYS